MADAVTRPVWNRDLAGPSFVIASPRSVPASSTGEPVLDLDYREDSTAEVDLNVVRLGRGGGLVEVQGTGEGGTYSPVPSSDALLDLAERRN